ncbi:hypothetical protein H8K38_03495 [Undibacterium sp. FT79W]|uniref:hypothetical protein n=1 Tax=Undibacterium sp. FT79W TaxID=2762296 RepID=UPI00164A3C82|nr:hypothetical protein [Undibacterium sp. FT79W]MBC3876868.1 hypothetical protein [Undibacterium sp. FT79W]
MKRTATQFNSKYKKTGVACLFVLSSWPAFATTELVLQLETSLSRDTNPFRFYDDQVGGGRKQEQIQRLTETVNASDIRAGAIIPLLSDQTRLTLSGSLGNRHYKEYRQLDHQPGAADAAFDWQAGKSVSGRVYAGKDKRLFEYINGSLTERDIAHSRRAGADVRIKPDDDWMLSASLFRNALNYDLDLNQLYNFDERGQQLGLRYMSPTGSSIEAGTRLSETRFADRTPEQVRDLDKKYKETELYLDGEWRYSIKTITSAHLGLIRRRYDVLHERDTRLFNAIWRGTYHYSTMLRLDLQLFDRPFTIVDPSILYVVSKGARVDALWKWSDKTNVNFSALLQNSDQELIPRLVRPDNNSSRKEKLQRIGVGASYQFERGFRLLFDSFYEKTDRVADDIKLRQGVVRLGIEYTFENLPGSAARLGLQRYQQSLSATEPIRE